MSGVDEMDLVNATCKLETACTKQLEEWDKKRTKKREGRRVTWESAWKEIEKNKPTRFRKPR